MSLEIIFREQHQGFLILTHILRLTTALTFHTAVLRPFQSQFHTPSGMQGREKTLERMAVEHRAQEPEVPVIITQPVSMRKEKLFSINLTRQRFPVQNHPAFLFQIIAAPDIMVAYKEMHLLTSSLKKPQYYNLLINNIL